jgi:hypothetical protein
MRRIIMSKQHNTEQRKTSAKPGTETTRGNPDDPRWKAADNLEQDNEAALGKNERGDKKQQAGG